MCTWAYGRKVLAIRLVYVLLFVMAAAAVHRLIDVQWARSELEGIVPAAARPLAPFFLVSLVIIFGHFFLPFLSLLRIDIKSSPKFVIPLAAWAWLMHYTDLTFNIMPVLHTAGFHFKWFWLDLGMIALMVGILAKVFVAKYKSAAPYPLKDPRLIEAMGHGHPVATQISGGELDETDDLLDAPEHSKKGAH